MITGIARAIVLLCSMSLVACTSMRVLDDRGGSNAGSSAPVTQALAPGDNVLITRKDGTRVALEVTATSADAVEGKERQSALTLRVPLSEIAKIERREISAARTTLLVVAAAAVAYYIIEAILISRLNTYQ